MSHNNDNNDSLPTFRQCEFCNDVEDDRLGKMVGEQFFCSHCHKKHLKSFEDELNRIMHNNLRKFQEHLKKGGKNEA